MAELLTRCVWPDLPDRFNVAVRQAVAFILERHTVSGIVAAGAIVRGKPDATSDLDIYVILRGDYRQRIQKFFNGVPAEIFVNPPAAIERYFAEEQATHRPITAHMLATGFPVLELDPIVDCLRQKARELLASPPAPPTNPEQERYMIASLFEDALDLVERDPALARILLHSAVLQMLQFRFVNAGRFVPRLKDSIQATTAQDPELGALVKQFTESPNLVVQVEVAGHIADRTVGARGFFEWESVPENVSD